MNRALEPSNAPVLRAFTKTYRRQALMETGGAESRALIRLAKKANARQMNWKGRSAGRLSRLALQPPTARRSAMSESDFRGPIGRVVEVTPRVQEAGILLDMRVLYPGETEAGPHSKEAVLVPASLVHELSDELRKALALWTETYQGR